MSTYHVLYNRLSRSNNGEQMAHLLDEILPGEKLEYHNTLEIESYDDFFAAIPESDKIIVAGGDGTLNRFINRTDHCYVPQQVFFFPAGSGNDFTRDIGKNKYCHPFEMRKYISNLPEVDINGKKQRFFNSVSIGIDAEVAHMADIGKAAGKKINYALLTVKALITKFKVFDATVTFEDGTVKNYKNTLFALTAKGKLFGGGIKVAPMQDRNNPDETLTFILVHGLNKFTTIILFASILIGQHTKFTRYVECVTGKDFKIEIDGNATVQLDGEVNLEQTGYHARAKHTVDFD